MKKIPLLLVLTLATSLLFLLTPGLAMASQANRIASKTPTVTKTPKTPTGPSKHYIGTVVNITSSSLTITLKGGSSVTFILSSKTNFHVKGRKASSFNTGDQVSVRAIQKSGVLNATDVVFVSKKGKTQH